MVNVSYRGNIVDEDREKLPTQQSQLTIEWAVSECRSPQQKQGSHRARLWTWAVMTPEVLECGWFSDMDLHSCAFLTGCLPANSAESGMCPS